MAQCPTCGSNVSDSADVCPDCGMDLKATSSPPSQGGPSLPPVPPSAPPLQQPNPPEVTAGAARLTLRRGGVLTQEAFPVIERSVLGRFDPETGPVDVDLGTLPEAVYVSRHHAEVWCDSAGQWFVKDLGSGNGTFVCAAGQRQFQRVTGDHSLKDGDDIALGNARFEFRID
jgi:pSer/pThr/pTyr-binding forkhead associated (FHA) protein